MTKILKIDNCLDCPFHKRIPSPLTGDSFDASDEDVVCTKQPDARRTTYENPKGYRAISVSERWESQRRKDCVIPKWCPL